MGNIVGLRWPSTKTSRRTNILTSSSIADNAIDSSQEIDLGIGGRLFRITTSVPAWIRMYSKSSYRTADLGRSISQDPTGEHGVLLDVLTTEDNLVLDLSPPISYMDLESEPTGLLPLTIVNRSGSTNVVFITMTHLILEY